MKLGIKFRDFALVIEHIMQSRELQMYVCLLQQDKECLIHGRRNEERTGVMYREMAMADVCIQGRIENI